VYRNESGALNEALSDINGAVVEWRRDNQVVSDNTWKVGEECWTPATPGDALRYMANPTQDGSSKDYWPERYTGTADNGGVHWNSGIANLAFKLLVTGGKHPRNKTPNVTVPALGMEKAAKIFHEANAACANGSTNFRGFRKCTADKALAFYGADAEAATHLAWDAVGVPTGVDPPPPPPAQHTPLVNGVPVTNLSGATGSKVYYSIVVPAGARNLKFTTTGTVGDPDIYIKFGGAPSTDVFDAKSETETANESVTIATPSAGTYYLLLNGYAQFSGLTLTGSFEGGTTEPPSDVLQNGVPKTGLKPATGEWLYFQFTVPAGKNPTSVVLNRLAAGQGDPDLYVRFGAKPTLTSYDCRPWLGGTFDESCTSRIQKGAGTYWVGIRGYRTVTAPEGAKVTAAWPQ
jgi:vibriolysin